LDHERARKGAKGTKGGIGDGGVDIGIGLHQDDISLSRALCRQAGWPGQVPLDCSAHRFSHLLRRQWLDCPRDPTTVRAEMAAWACSQSARSAEQQEEGDHRGSPLQILLHTRGGSTDPSPRQKGRDNPPPHTWGQHGPIPQAERKGQPSSTHVGAAHTSPDASPS
jgi:hypothetical protein